MKRCYKCQREFTDAQRFCGGCGGALSEVAQSNNGAAPHCPRCATTLRAGWKFCGKCQMPLPTPMMQPQPPPAPQPMQVVVAQSAIPAPSITPPAPVPDLINALPCPACGMPVEDDGGEFCEYCGANMLGNNVMRISAPAPEPRPLTIPPVPPAPPVVSLPAAHEEPVVSSALLAPPFAADEAPAEAETLPPEDAVPPGEAGTTSTASTDPSAPVAAESDFTPAEPFTAPEKKSAPVLDTTPPPELFQDVTAPARFSGNVKLMIGGAAALVLLLIAVVGSIKWQAQPAATVKPPASASTANAATPASVGVPDSMVLVAGGSFHMGRDDGDEYERPVHLVTVKPFYLDMHEVTCEQYAKFTAATGQPPPSTWTNGRYDTTNARLPVTGVSWVDALAYAQWAHKRLPTEEEWEFAARGQDGRLYPWGNEWQPNAANAADTSAGKMVAVGSYPAGRSPSGALDMVGNAWEWTASSPAPYPGGHLPKQLADNLKVIRGNFWGSKTAQATVTYRGFWAASGAETYRDTGFRCARDIDAAPVH